MSNQRRPRARGSDSAAESLRGKNRELQKAIRQLEQRIRELEKQLGLKSTLSPIREEESVLPVPKPVTCENCGKGSMTEFVIEKPGGNLIFLTCEICKHRQKKTK